MIRQFVSVETKLGIINRARNWLLKIFFISHFSRNFSHINSVFVKNCFNEEYESYEADFYTFILLVSGG